VSAAGSSVTAPDTLRGGAILRPVSTAAAPVRQEGGGLEYVRANIFLTGFTMVFSRSTLVGPIRSEFVESGKRAPAHPPFAAMRSAAESDAFSFYFGLSTRYALQSIDKHFCRRELFGDVALRAPRARALFP
jgi:hypothetical protein